MGGKSCLKYFLTVAVAASSIAVSLSLKSKTNAQVRSNIPAESSFEFQNRLDSPWSNAELIHTLESTSAINAIAFSPNGEILADVGSDRITLWNPKQGKIRGVLPSHYSTKYDLKIAPTAIAFSPDSRFVATVTWSQGLLSPDESLLVWDVDTKEKILGLKESAGCRKVLFNVTGDTIYGACELGVTAWSFPEGDKLFSFDTKYPVDAIALSHDGKIMATVDANITGGQQGEKSTQIQLWQLDGDNSTLLNTLDGHTNDIARIEFTSDDRKLVSSSYDGKINVWNWREGTISRNTNNLYSSNGLFDLSGDSRLIAGNFHSSVMTSLVTGLPLRNAIAQANRQEIQMLTFSHQSELFAGVTRSQNGDRDRIYIWHNNEQKQQALAIEDEYLSIDIAEFWDNSSPEKADPSNTKPSSIGKDPQEIALAALGLTEIVESETETVEIDYPQDDVAVATIVQTNLPNDSVAGIRYKIKFAPYGDPAQKLWQVVWAGQQFKCYRDRDRQSWNKALCP